MKHRVLIATYYWPPSGGAGVQRYLKFAKYLDRFDIEPVILTVENPTYPIQDATLQQDIPGYIQVYKSKTVEPFGVYAGLSGETAEDIKPTTELEGDNLKSKLGSWIRANVFVPDARVGWLLTARRKAEQLIEDLDISTVITTGPPHSVHFIGRHTQEKLGVRWLADFRDPWSGIYYNQVLPRTDVADQFDKKLELAILKDADEVIVVTRSQAEEFRKIRERAYHVITNGFDPDDFSEIPDEASGPPPFIIRHVGSIGEVSVPVSFLQALTMIPPEMNVRVEFIGHVHRKLQEQVKELNLGDKVVIRDYMPHREALDEMCTAHILLLCLPDVPSIGHHIPGKLFEYLGSGRPVLMTGPEKGDSADIIRKMGAGVVCSFHDREGIAKGIQSLCEGAGQESPPRPGDAHPFSRVNLTQSLADIIRHQPD